MSASPLARVTSALLALVLVSGLVTVAYHAGTQRQPADRVTLPGELAPLAEIYDRIQRRAVAPPDDRVLLEGAIEGMLDTLDDPYSMFYGPEAFAELEDALEGRFTGVGMVLEDTPDGLTVVSVLPDSPAEAAGIEPGERLVTVDGRDVRDLPLEVVVNRVRGAAGDPVALGFEGGPTGPRELELVRAELDLPTTEARMLDDGAGYVRLLTFSERAAQTLRAEVVSLIEQGAHGIVLDLRSNPGGLLREAVAVANVFIDDGPIVSVKERVGEREVFRADGEAATDAPLVALVDRGTASAAEIVAAAIQELGRGELVGTRTFGKGTVQTISMLSDGSGVKFTTAEYFTPGGDSIEETGVVPDRVVAERDDQLAAAQEVLRAILAGAPAPAGG
jgi:carboxyl-terminal processing protease